jgi:hypothetical protein
MPSWIQSASGSSTSSSRRPINKAGDVTRTAEPARWRVPRRGLGAASGHSARGVCCAQARADRAFCDRWLRCGCVPAAAGASGGRRVPSLRSRSVCGRPVFTISARSALRCQGPTPPARSRPRRPTRPVPAAGGRRPSARPRRRPGSSPGRLRTPIPGSRTGGPGPVQGQKNQLELRPGPAVIASHPGIAAPAAGVRQAPGLQAEHDCRARR